MIGRNFDGSVGWFPREQVKIAVSQIDGHRPFGQNLFETSRMIGMPMRETDAD